MHSRTATLEDLPAICRLGAEVNDIHHQAFPDVFAAPGADMRDAEHWTQSLVGDAVATWVAEDSGVVGFLTVGMHTESHSLLQPVRIGRVGSVCVAAGYRSRGIGRALMALAEDWVVHRGGTEVRLTVWAFNARAVSLYEELGFEVRSQLMAKRLRRPT